MYKFRVSRMDCLDLVRGNLQDAAVRAQTGSVAIELRRDSDGNYLLGVQKDGVSRGMIAGSGPYVRCMPASSRDCLNGLLPLLAYVQARTQSFVKHMTINGHMPSLAVSSSFMHFTSILKDMGLDITSTPTLPETCSVFHVIGLDFFDVLLKFNHKFISKLTKTKSGKRISRQHARTLAVNTAYSLQSLAHDNNSHAVSIHADSMQVVVLTAQKTDILKQRCTEQPITRFSIRLGDTIRKYPVFDLKATDQLGSMVIPVNNCHVLVGSLPTSTFRAVSQLSRGDDATPDFSQTYLRMCRILRTIVFHHDILRGVREQYEDILACFKHHVKLNSSQMTPWENCNLRHLSENPDARCHSLWFFHADPNFLSLDHNS